MSFGSMQSQISGIVPKFPFTYGATCINYAYRDVLRKNLWSFLMLESNWTSPPPYAAGTVTVVQGSNLAVFDAAVASPGLAAIQASGIPTPLLKRQFRVQISTIYNIWGYAINGGTGVVTLTLDRTYQEPSQTSVAYNIFECYYVSPVQDFWAWISIRDINDFNELRTTKNRKFIDDRDPQRTLYYIPTDVVPYQVDLNPASPTVGWPMFEMWGGPQQELTYQLFLIRRGQPLVNLTDTLPWVIGEDLVMARAYWYAYEWAEANKVDSRSQGSDFRFLMGQTMQDYTRLFREYRVQDQANANNFITRLRRGWTWPSLWGFYNAIGNTANAGAPW